MTDASHLTRRHLLKAGVAAGSALTAGSLFGLPQAVALTRTDRPTLTHGVASGDITETSGLVWTRADRPARMVVEFARDESFAHSRRVRGPVLSPRDGGTGKVRLTGLAPGQQVHYRVVAEDLDSGLPSEPVIGRFSAAPVDAGGLRLVWSGDVAGQGWGINPDIGGMTTFAAMAERRPDLFLHCGDSVYADGPLQETVTLPDGRTWRNVVTDEKSKVAETLDEFRGQFAYNLLDDNVRAFNASVPTFAQWDDHEVVNNWYPGEILDSPEYTEKRVDVLAARALRAFHEWFPIDARAAVDGRVYRSFRWGKHVEVFVLDMRSYKEPNNASRTEPGRVLGRRQARWLVNGLSRSTATWKVIQADLPFGLVVPDGDDIEGVANGLPGEPGGRESELAWVLHAIARRKVRNVVWLTADVHYSAAHHYSPERAAVDGFEPFWEFVAGPINAGAFGPNELDPTFGPEVVFEHAAPEPNATPMDGYQSFGEIEVAGDSGALTVALRDGTGAALWTKTLQPRRR